MIRPFLRRWALGAAPLLMAAGWMGGLIPAAAAFACWMALGWRLSLRIPGLYPGQRRPRPRRLIPALVLGWAVLIIPKAAPIQADFPVWMGAAFFASVLCGVLL